MPDRILLELSDELIDPIELALEKMVEESTDAELDAISGVDDFDDDVIQFIANGDSISLKDGIDYTEFDEQIWG